MQSYVQIDRSVSVTSVVFLRERLLTLERPVQTALLASLAGVKCFYGNQWHCRLTDNATKLSTLLQGFYFVRFI